MSVKLKFCGVFLILSLFCVLKTSGIEVFCYYASYNSGTYAPEEIDTSVCSHINYAFVGINADGTLRLDSGDDIIRRLSALKNTNPNVKLLVSVGGWNEGSEVFSQVAADATKKQTLAQSAVSFFQTYNFDGLDVDWEYPGQRGGVPEDEANFVDMLTTLRNAFDASGYLLTVAVNGDPEAGSYNVASIAQAVHYVNVMSYDFHSSANGKTGQCSPLYPSSTDSEWETTHACVQGAVNNWINGGTPAAKAVLGMAFYGKGFTLADPNNHGVGSPCVGDGQGGTYDVICAWQDGWTEEWDDEQKNPYKYAGDQWVGYDNPQSIGLKVQYAKSQGLGGVMMWSVDQDDKDGSCGGSLLNAIRDNL